MENGKGRKQKGMAVMHDEGMGKKGKAEMKMEE